MLYRTIILIALGVVSACKSGKKSNPADPGAIAEGSAVPGNEEQIPSGGSSEEEIGSSEEEIGSSEEDLSNVFNKPDFLSCGDVAHGSKAVRNRYQSSDVGAGEKCDDDRCVRLQRSVPRAPPRIHRQFVFSTLRRR